jgi:hypothetical protein
LVSFAGGWTAAHTSGNITSALILFAERSPSNAGVGWAADTGPLVSSAPARANAPTIRVDVFTILSFPPFDFATEGILPFAPM